jgi:hypothetical protein
MLHISRSFSRIVLSSYGNWLLTSLSRSFPTDARHIRFCDNVLTLLGRFSHLSSLGNKMSRKYDCICMQLIFFEEHFLRTSCSVFYKKEKKGSHFKLRCFSCSSWQLFFGQWDRFCLLSFLGNAAGSEQVVLKLSVIFLFAFLWHKGESIDPRIYLRDSNLSCILNGLLIYLMVSSPVSYTSFTKKGVSNENRIIFWPFETYSLSIARHFFESIYFHFSCFLWVGRKKEIAIRTRVFMYPRERKGSWFRSNWVKFTEPNKLLIQVSDVCYFISLFLCLFLSPSLVSHSKKKVEVTMRMSSSFVMSSLPSFILDSLSIRVLLNVSCFLGLLCLDISLDDSLSLSLSLSFPSLDESYKGWGSSKTG